MFVETKEHGEVQAPALDESGKLLLKAADLIEQRGWTQGEMDSPKGVCVLGALGWGRGHNPARTVAIIRFQEAIGGCSVMLWNDENGRTQSEVVAKLREVALS